MEIVITSYFFAGFVSAFLMTLICIFLPSKFIRFIDSDSFGAKTLSENVVTGIKSVVGLSVSWFVFLGIEPQEETHILNVLGKQSTLEVLGVATSFITVLTLLGLTYGIAIHQEASGKVHKESLSNMAIRFLTVIPAIMALTIGAIHIHTFDYFDLL